MGYGISHQKAGLNWPRRYKEWSRERRLADAFAKQLQHKGTKTQRHEERTGMGCRVSGIGNSNGEHAKWRRITGITSAVEGVLTAKERRKGLRRLVERIKTLTAEDAEENPKSETRNPKQTQNCKTENDPLCRSSDDERRLPLTKGEKTARPLSLTTEWEVDVEAWAGAAGNSIERLCAELQISRARLTMLTKEYCGLTAQELVDGFKVRELRRHLVVRFHEAAERLWGLPGTFAAWKYEGFRVSTRRHEDSKTRRGGEGKQSRYFRMRPEEYAAEERYEERERRIGELAREVRRDFDLESWAASAGFGSGARLKRACVNVLGKSLRTLERQLAIEVVRYYLCAEDKAMREIACQETESPNVIRARWVYNESEDAPTEPFLDEWSKAEALARDWLERMRRDFG